MALVLLAVIGPRWLAAADERVGRRLDDPDDLVRLEVGTALARGVRVIPVLLEGAVMPRRKAIERVFAPAVVGDAEGGRAARLPGEAERLVKTFTDGSGKALALIEVANAVAVSDPGSAVRIATSISSEYAKVHALSGIAKALTA